jgi:hypothetical protein
VLSITLAALVAAGCVRERSAQQADAPLEASKAQGDVAERQAAPAAAPAAPGPQVQPAGLEAMAAARKLIRTGQMTLVVESFVQASDEVKRIAERNGGYLAEAQTQRGAQDRRHGSLTIRVDAGRFDVAVAAVRALGDVRTENVGTQDVTKAYTDLETRLRVKRETADRLREILRTRTAKLAEVLEAERELARVTEEIERMEGERRFYDQQVAFSTLTVTLQERAAIVEAGVFAPLADAMRDSLRVLATSLAALLYLIVFLAPWVLLAWIAWRITRRLRARRAAAITTKERA